MNKKISPILISLLLLCGQQIQAQPSELGNWIMYFGNQSLGKGFSLHNEVQYRNYNAIGDLEQLLLRGGIGYDLTENNNTILLGYGFIETEVYVGNTDQKVAFSENRIFQQLISKQKFHSVSIQHRYRIEERWLQNDFRMRFRYFLKVVIPLTDKEIKEKTIYLAAYNEVFLNHESPVFDRNRYYGAVGYAFSRKLKLEVGFMKQTVRNGDRNQIQIALFNSLPFLTE